MLEHVCGEHAIVRSTFDDLVWKALREVSDHEPVDVPAGFGLRRPVNSDHDVPLLPELCREAAAPSAEVEHASCRTVRDRIQHDPVTCVGRFLPGVRRRPAGKG